MNTTKIVPTPPETTEKTGETSQATKPDSNPPNSLEVPMKRLLTAETRPRFASGVSNWTSVWRTTTLMLSKAPQTNSIEKENQKDRESPKATVAIPKPATAQSKARPAFCIG